MNILIDYLFLSLKFLKEKIHEKGLFYCVKTEFKIIFLYVLINFNKLIYLMKKPFRCMAILLLKREYNNIGNRKKLSNVLYAFYDLEVSPATFDITTFLILAEIARKKKCCDSIHLIIVPGPDSGFRSRDLNGYNILSGNQNLYDHSYLKWRLDNIVIPCCGLLPSCNAMSIFSTREDALKFEALFADKIFPENYSVYYPDSIIKNDGYHHIEFIIDLIKQNNEMPDLIAPKKEIDIINKWIEQNCGSKKLITITLRESPHGKERNSNLIAWADFIRSIDQSKYFPVILRDTEKALEQLPPELIGLTVFPEAPFNIYIRAALYQLSFLNMSVVNGPFSICLYNSKISCILFVPCKGEQINLKQQVLRWNDIELGSQPVICGPFQRWVWEADTFEVIQREFKKMVEKIEDAEKK